jgi:hypothetical protein
MKFRYFLFIFSITVIGLILFFLRTNQVRQQSNTSNSHIAEIVIDDTTFTFESKTPKVKILSSDKEHLQNLLEKASLYPFDQVRFTQSYNLDRDAVKTALNLKNIRKIHIQIHDLGEGAPRQESHIFTQGIANQDAVEYHYGKITHSYTEITIPLYIDIELVKQINQPADKLYSFRIMSALYLNFKNPQLQEGVDPFRDLFQKITAEDKPFIYLQIDNLQTSVDKLGKKVSSILELVIPQVYAQSCTSGSARCGSLGSAGSQCSGGPYNGQPCFDSSECGGGSCVGISSCTTGTLPDQCQNTTVGSTTLCGQICTCSSGSCAGGSSCTPTWSACSKTCGGGTQTSSNCGPTQTRACNTQACVPFCGDTSCNGTESCSSCSTDCGSCGGSFCGDGSCNSNEGCGTCSSDCGSCSCTPTCVPLCGQTSCGTTCGNSDTIAPAAPTGQTPVNGGSAALNGSNQITVSWAAVSGSTIVYDVQVYPTGTPAGQECLAADTHCNFAQSSTNYSFPISGTTGQSYTWRVRAINTSCSAGGVTGPWTSPITFTVQGTISGTIYFDPNNAAALSGTICQLSGASTQDPGAGSSVQAVAGSTTVPGSITGSSYTIPNVPYNANTIVTLTPDLNQWSCSCPAGCSYSGLSSPLGGVAFYLTNVKSGWWQTSNGLLFAQDSSGTAIQSKVPVTCSGATCTRALSTNDSAGTANSFGYAVTGGGGIDSTDDSSTTLSYLNPNGTSEHITGSSIAGAHENYAYFSQLYSMGQSPTVDFTGAKPTAAPANGRAYYGSGNISINTPWTVGSSEKMVVFVNGSVTIHSPITVTPGGFLAIISTGNITFANDLGSADPTSTTAVVAGVFISDGQIVIEGGRSGGDLKFIGEGSYIGWGGFQFGRTYGTPATNNTAPSEYFRFRPDFMVNVPERMTRPIYVWQETN